MQGRTSTFVLCTALPDKYPRQPVLQCIAFVEGEKPPAEEDEGAD